VLKREAMRIILVSGASRLRPGAKVPLRAQQGAIAVMTAGVLVVMLAFFGFAIDLSRAFNRKAELQNLADAAALAAARALDGTPAGITRAKTAAASTASGFGYSYNKAAVSWRDTAIRFGTNSDGGSSGWLDADAVNGSAASVFFVRVDTSALDASHGRVKNVFIPVLASAFAETNVVGYAVAGRSTINITPLAVCANSNTPAVSRSGELVEYGFRRGVAYDLMQLNPTGTTPENFLVNPIAPSGTVGASIIGNLDVVKPFICNGSLAMPTVSGGLITVERSFPIGSLFGQLNSRFGTSAAPCQPTSAPADMNVTSFAVNGGANWMNNTPDGQTAKSIITGHPDGSSTLWTVADPTPSPAATKGTEYGPLWSYAKAAKYSSYVSNGGVEPKGGYSTYSTSDWGTLYTPGKPVVNSGTNAYPGTTPYQATGGALAYKTFRNTRVLNIPLLECPVPSGAKASAKVLAVARFFMTIPANTTSVPAEFAGLAPESEISGNVELY
jgi:Flp pilus assembly protein TadG